MHVGMKVGDEVHHLMSKEMTGVEVLLDLDEGTHVMSARGDDSPRFYEGVLHSFELPKKAEDLEVPKHHLRSQDSVQWFIDEVVERKDLPTTVARILFIQSHIKSIQELWIMVLDIRPAHSLLENVRKVMSIHLAGRLVELHGHEVHQVLNEVSLAQQKILSDCITMIKELVLAKHDLNKPFVCLKRCLVDPLSHELKVKFIVCPIDKLKRLIQNPIFFLTASPDEVDCLSCLKDLIEFFCQEGWNSGLDNLVFVSPESGVRNRGVHCNEELLVWVIQFSFDHPCFDHSEQRS